MSEVIAYELLDRINGESDFLWQGDYGQKMKLTGIDLPVSYTVHFANSSRGDSIPSIGDETGVAIPDQVLTSGKTVYFWLFLHANANNGQTVYANMIKVHPRTALPTIDPPTPEEQSILDQLMAALEAGIEHVEDIAEAIPGMVDDEIELKKDEFKGDPGTVFTPHIEDGVMSWSNDGDLPNPEPTDFNTELGLANFATRQDLETKMDSAMAGQANGVASLDSTGRVPSAQLPSYVDDVVEYPSVSQFPVHGETGKIYISTSNNHQYRWTGTQYVDMTSGDLSTKADKRDTVLETTLSRGRKANTEAGTASVAFGDNVESSGVYSQAFGQETKASGGCAHAEGYGTQALGNLSHAEGYETTANGLESHAEGANTTASSDYTHAEGYYTTASDSAAHAEGYNATASGFASHAEGMYTLASYGAHSEGNGTKAQGNYSHAEGLGGTFTKDGDGYTSGAFGNNSHSEGNTTRAGGVSSHSEGTQTIASGDSSHAEGYMTEATATCAHSEGSNTKASGLYSHAEGVGGTIVKMNNTYTSGAAGQYSHSEGDATLASGTASHTEGHNTIASDDYTHAEGTDTIASNDAAHAEGAATTASGQYSHSEGASTVASGNCSHSEGGNTSATGQCAHSEGGGTQATGINSHAEGAGSQATGAQSHAEGGNTHATGASSHSEGTGTTASGDYSHSEGGGSNAAGSYAHAEGGGTWARGLDSHAEGGGTQANGEYGHSEGSGTQANGQSSHAEGSGAQANATAAHAEGYGTLATGARSHVGGMSNIADSYDDTNWPEWTPGEHCVPGDKRKRTRVIDEQTVIEGFVCTTENTDADWDITHWQTQYGVMNYAVIIGNGAGSYDRSNAYALDWDGNGYFAGDVYVGCNPDGSGGTKLENTVFATDNEVQAIISGYGVSA